MSKKTLSQKLDDVLLPYKFKANSASPSSINSSLPLSHKIHDVLLPYKYKTDLVLCKEFKHEVVYSFQSAKDNKHPGYADGFYEHFLLDLADALNLENTLEMISNRGIVFDFRKIHLFDVILEQKPSLAEFARYCQIGVHQDITTVNSIFTSCTKILCNLEDNEEEKKQYYRQLIIELFARGVDYKTNAEKYYQINIDTFIYKLAVLKLDYEQGKNLMLEHFKNSKNLDYFSDAEKISMTHKLMRNEADKAELLACLNIQWDNQQPGIECETRHITAIHLDKFANIYEHEFNYQEDFERYMQLIMSLISPKSEEFGLSEISCVNSQKKVTVFAQSLSEQEDTASIEMLNEVIYTALNLFKSHMKRDLDKLTNDVFVPGNLGFDMNRLILNAKLNQELSGETNVDKADNQTQSGLKI